MSEGGSSALRSLIGVVVVAALSAGAYELVRTTPTTAAAPVGTQAVSVTKTWPAPAKDEASSPLGRPARPPAGKGGYTFMHKLPDGRPVTYDPCRPIHYVLAAGAPAYARPLLARSLHEVSQATGLQFVYDGTTEERPSTQRDPYQPDRYGDRWAPVLIAWTTSSQVRRLKGDVAGLGGSEEVVPPGNGTNALHYVTGSVVFDGPALRRIRASTFGLTISHDVVLHELGHLVGLGHVKEPTQVMYPKAGAPLPGYGDGDLRGLAQLGEGTCYPAG